MKSTRLVQELRRVEALFDHNAMSPAHREAIRHDLLDLVVLRRPPSTRLSRAVRDQLLNAELLDRCGYVSAALHAMAQHGLSIPHAAQMCGLHEHDINFAIELLKRAGRSLAWVEENVDDAVRASIDAATMRLVVELAPSAVAEMISAAIESAAQRSGPTEMFGELYGHAVIEPLDEKNERLHTIHVTRFALQATARATRCSVSPSKTSHRVHELVSRALYGDGSMVVGYTHSHPWASPRQLLDSRGWRFSTADEEHCRSWQEERRATGQRGYTSIIVAIAPGSTHGDRVRRLTRNRLCFRVGNWQVFIAAYRCQLDGDLDAELGLEAPGLFQDVARVSASIS